MFLFLCYPTANIPLRKWGSFSIGWSLRGHLQSPVPFFHLYPNIPDRWDREQDFTISFGSPFQQPIGSASFLFHVILRVNILFFLENKKKSRHLNIKILFWIFWTMEVEISLASAKFCFKPSPWDNPPPCSCLHDYRLQNPTCKVSVDEHEKQITVTCNTGACITHVHMKHPT